MWLPEETGPFALHIFNRLVFITESEFTARYALALYITRIRFVLKGAGVKD
jgi:hypothetical protein